ncbi:MAG: hypothetical protein A3I00_01235, partial [Betaproteobacteria bacterium RIFCSPLOWO2_02_FULL_64_12]
MTLNLSCREASRLLSQAMDRDLKLTERVALRLHMAICIACTRFSAQMQFLRRAMNRYPGP